MSLQKVLWGSCCSNFSLLCSVLQIIVCLFTPFHFFRCIVCPSIYGFWLPLWLTVTKCPRLKWQWIYYFLHRRFLSSITTLPEHLSSPPVISGVRVTRSLVLYVCFVDRCLSFCTFSLCCLFFDIRILIAPMVSSNSSWLYIWVTRRVFYKKQELTTLRQHMGSPPVFLVGSVLPILLVFCVVLLYVFTFSTLRQHMGSPPVFLVGSVFLIPLVFCVVLLYVFTFWWVPCLSITTSA
jgi:hypothetical protein